MIFQAQALTSDERVIATETREVFSGREAEEFRAYFAKISGKEPHEIRLVEVSGKLAEAVPFSFIRGGSPAP